MKSNTRTTTDQPEMEAEEAVAEARIGQLHDFDAGADKPFLPRIFDGPPTMCPQNDY